MSRVLTVGFVAVCFHPLHARGAFDGLGGPGHALLLLVLLTLTALCDAVLAAALAHSRTGWPFPPLLRDELRAVPGIGAAVVATGAVMALGTAVAGLWALPVFSVPLLLAQGLSLPQVHGGACHLPADHRVPGAGHRDRRVHPARALAPGRRAQPGGGPGPRLTEPELTVLEYAALMHDIGQLSLVDPVPEGATAGLPPARAAADRAPGRRGGAADRGGPPGRRDRRTPGRPAREQPGRRIVRVVNAYDEKCREGGPGGPLVAALEELRLEAAGEYAPEVVEALARVLSRDTEGTREQVDRSW
ncbi:HD/PDEase domain-containing protein OS=Streptomyces albaduncus OX=68172 GN=FHS32_004835 PE=4 SV=1 [Streptomyces griseoloalbus]